jgi:hypothetical protein
MISFCESQQRISIKDSTNVTGGKVAKKQEHSIKSEIDHRPLDLCLFFFLKK